MTSRHKACVTKYFTETNTEFDWSVKKNMRSELGTQRAAADLVKARIDYALLPVVSNEAAIAAKMFDRANIKYTTSATSTSAIGQLGQSMFTSTYQQAITISKFAEVQDGAVILVDAGGVYSKAFIRGAIETLADMDVQWEVLRTQQVLSLPDLSGRTIFAPLYGPDIARLYLKATESGDNRIYGPDSIGVNAEFLEIVAGAPIGKTDLYFIRNWDSVLRGPNEQRFIQDVVPRCGNELITSFVAAYTFDMFGQFIASQKGEPWMSIMTGEEIGFNFERFAERRLHIYHFDGTTPNARQIR
ncbi:MAG: hypothetical protein HWE20_04740 [Gammaproteobacteria bacterium]|nr:hypothetical protein [Gammaproteobacteria bacterium]